MRYSKILPLSSLLMLAPAWGQTSYDQLLSMHREFRDFRPYRLSAGVRDTGPATITLKRSRLRRYQQRLESLSREDWSISQQVDYLLVRARMNDLDFELRVVRPWARDPGYYLDQIRRVPHAELPLAGAELERWKERLESVPLILEQARENLTEPAHDLARLALRHLERYDGVGQGEPWREVPPRGVRGWYRDLLERVRKHHPSLAGTARKAVDAVEAYHSWLARNLDQMTAPSGVGLDHYAWYLRHVRYLPYTVSDLRLLSRRELSRIQAFLEIEKNRNRHLPELRVPLTRSEFDRSIKEAERKIRDFMREQELVTVPEYMPPEFETDVFWIIRPGNRYHFWEQISYRDPLNNHIHASIPGHRFDTLMQRRHPNPIRRSHSDGSRAEGWGFYIEEMFLQAGLLDDRPRVRELFYIAALKRAVRIPAELGLQSGEMDLEQAMKYMKERVPLLDDNLARYDLEVYLRRPTYGMNYTMGKIQLERLIGERALQLGEEFKLGEFHDRFLSAGMIPISLIRWEMTGLDDEVRELREMD